jgi:hypothetical protein
MRRQATDLKHEVSMAEGPPFEPQSPDLGPADVVERAERALYVRRWLDSLEPFNGSSWHSPILKD